MTSRRKRRAAAVLLFLGVGAAALAVVFVAAALRMPTDAPLARMYRTESDIASLLKAVDVYKQAYGQYPPPGVTGLRMATDHLSGSSLFFPDGPPPDAWDRPYVYVAHTDYENPEWAAQRCGNGFCASQTFQVYSMGADGLHGTGDDINSWDESRAWRPGYKGMNEAFMRQRTR